MISIQEHNAFIDRLHEKAKAEGKSFTIEYREQPKERIYRKDYYNQRGELVTHVLTDYEKERITFIKNKPSNIEHVRAKQERRILDAKIREYLVHEEELETSVLTDEEGLDDFEMIYPIPVTLKLKVFKVEPEPVKIMKPTIIKKEKVIKEKKIKTPKIKEPKPPKIKKIKEPKPKKLPIVKFITMQAKEKTLKMAKVRTPSEEKRYQRMKRYNEIHREEIRKWRRRYYLNHREEVREKSREKWRQHRDERDKTEELNKVVIKSDLKPLKYPPLKYIPYTENKEKLKNDGSNDIQKNVC